MASIYQKSFEKIYSIVLRRHAEVLWQAGEPFTAHSLLKARYLMRWCMACLQDFIAMRDCNPERGSYFVASERLWNLRGLVCRKAVGNVSCGEWSLRNQLCLYLLVKIWIVIFGFQTPHLHGRWAWPKMKMVRRMLLCRTCNASRRLIGLAGSSNGQACNGIMELMITR